VTEVRQQDIPVTGDWVGTTDGYINAQIRAKVQGYLLKQGYRDGSTVTAGQLLYQLDPRQYQADLDKAQRRPRTRQCHPDAGGDERS
jgi:membrane fusion protein (multidrug efflux system)